MLLTTVLPFKKFLNSTAPLPISVVLGFEGLGFEDGTLRLSLRATEDMNILEPFVVFLFSLARFPSIM